MAQKKPAGNGPYDAIIVGAGIAGCTLAWELARRGIRPVVLEQNWIAAESSGRNTGTLLGGPQTEVVELLDACAAIYEELADGPVPFEFARIGQLLVSATDEALERGAEIPGRMETVGHRVERVSGETLARDHPRLKLNVAGGFFVDRAWTLEPMGATHAFAHAAREAGAEFRTGCRVVQVHSRGGKVEGVLTDDGIIAADMVFLANGGWTGELMRRVVGDGPLPALPFTAGRGWLIQFGPLGFDLPWIMEELTWPDQEELGRRMALGRLSDVADQCDDLPAVEALCLNPMRGGDARMGASIQPAFRDLVRNTDMPARIAGRAMRLIGAMEGPRVQNVYPGNRPMVSDGLPVAGRSPIEGLYIHGGMGSIGMHAAPATARWLAEAVVSGDGNPGKPWLVPGRFPGWA